MVRIGHVKFGAVTQKQRIQATLAIPHNWAERAPMHVSFLTRTQAWLEGLF